MSTREREIERERENYFKLVTVYVLGIQNNSSFFQFKAFFYVVNSIF